MSADRDRFSSNRGRVQSARKEVRRDTQQSQPLSALSDMEKKSYFFYLQPKAKHGLAECSTKSTAGFSSKQKRTESVELKTQRKQRLLVIGSILRTIPEVLTLSPSELKSAIPIKSSSLKRQIQHVDSQGSHVSQGIGIGSQPDYQIPKNSSEYYVQQAVCKNRQRRPQFFKSMMNNFTEMCNPVSRDITNMKQFCRNQDSLERVGKKYFNRNRGSLMSSVMRLGHFNVADIIEKRVKESMKAGTKTQVRGKIKQQVSTKVQQHENRINYLRVGKLFEQDSMFRINARDFKRFSERYMLNNKFCSETKEYHKYYDYYTQVQDDIFYDVDQEQLEYASIHSQSSDDTVALKEFYANTDQSRIQMHNFGTNIRNPFLGDPGLVKIMKLSGILKKQLKKKI